MRFASFSEYVFDPARLGASVHLVVAARAEISGFIFDLTSRLASSLNTRIPTTIGICGIKKAFTASEYAGLARTSPHRQARGKLITPVMSALDGRLPSILILRETDEVPVPFDLGDFADQLEVAGCEIVVASQAAATIDNFVAKATIESVCLTPLDAVPLSWAGESWIGNSSTMGIEFHGSQPTSAQLILPVPPGTAIAVDVIRSDGSSSRFVEASQETTFQLLWTGLENGSNSIISALVRRQPFKCPFCPETHNAGTLFCPKSRSLLGDFVIPAIPVSPGRGVVLVRRSSEGFDWVVLDRATFVLESGEVISRTSGKAERLKRGPSGQWTAIGTRPAGVEELGEELYALFT